MVRLAIVGIGGYGWQLVGYIQRAAERGHCRLVAAADMQWARFADRAQELKAAGVELFDDALKMFGDLKGKVDGVYVATGIGSHAMLTAAAAEAGYQVHLEKPPAATVQEVDRMIDALDKHKRFCLVGFQALQSEDVLFVKDRIAAGRLGKVTSMACSAGWPRTRNYYGRNNWAGRLRVGDEWVLDGPATNALAHQIANMLLWACPRPGCLADPAAVRAELYAAGPIESHDTAAIEVKTADGPATYFLASHCTSGSFNPVIELSAEKGSVHWEYHGGAKITYADGTVETCPHDQDQHVRMVANFADAIVAGDASLLRCRLDEARKVVLALNGAHESSRRIHRIDGRFVSSAEGEDGSPRTVAADMDALLSGAASQRMLLSDLRPAPAWAQPTEPFDLTGYRSFPKLFGS